MFQKEFGFTRAYLRVGCLVAAAIVLQVASNAQAKALPDFTDLVRESAPAVVNISTTEKKSFHPALPKGFQIPELEDGGPLAELFRRFFGEEGEDHGLLDRQSLGSGFIISNDGYILTNYHVVDGADEILVRMSDRREFVATLVGADRRSDIALLKIPSDHLPVVKIGQSADLEVGEWVLAIGSPFGFEHSVTAGIVSAKGRSLPNENYVPFIQTDVAINPGNSGGPLFNLEGDVVGMNSQIYSRTGGFMGLSFAIPIDVAMDVVDQLKTSGRVTRGWLGVLIQDISGELADSFGLDHPRGALVAKVMAGSPAQSAGIQVGDVILAFNGAPLTRSSDLPPRVGASPIGKKATLDILRNGKNQRIDIRVEALPGEDEIIATVSPRVQGRSNRMGVKVTAPTAQQRETLDLAPETGVVIQDVTGAPAKASGLRQGDVILMIDNIRVRNVRQFEKLVENLPDDKSVAVLVQRASGPMFLALRLADK